MAEYDGSIRIGTGIDTKGVKKGVQEIEKDLKRLKAIQKEFRDIGGDQESSIYKEREKDIQKLERSLKALKAAQKEAEPSDDYFNKLKSNVEEYAKSLKELKGQGKYFGDEDYDKVYLAWKNATDAVKAYQAELNKETESWQAKEEARINALQAKEEERRAKEIAAIHAEEQEEQRLNRIRVNATASNQQIIDMVERRKQLIAEIADMERAGVGLGYAQYDSANKELEEINIKIKEYKRNLSSVPEKLEGMRKSARKAFDAMSKGSKDVSVSLSKGLKTILKYGFGIRSLYVLFNKIRNGIQEGFKNLMGYSDSFANSVQSVKNSMSTLGNQIAGAFRPIVEAVIPWLNSLINALTAAMAKLAQFIALIAGKSTFTKAKQIQDSYNKSLGGTAKAADKARGALAKFDDLDVLEKQQDASGGGAGAETDFSDMFEEVPVDKNLPKWLDSILARLKELKDIFMDGFWDGLGDFGYRVESIKKSLSSIKDNLIDIWTDPAVLSASKRYADSVAYMLGSLAGSVVSIGLTIATNLIGGIAKYLEQNKGRIKEYLIDMFNVSADINDMFAYLFQSIAYVFEAFASENGQQLTANIIGMFSDAFMGASEIVLKLARDILNVFIQPFIDHKEEFRTALEGLLGVLAEVTGTIKQGIDDTFDKLNEVYDAHFKPFFDSITNGLSQMIGKFLEFWNGNIQPILDSFAQKFDEVIGQHVQPMINAAIELFGQIADTLKALWENILLPLVNWLVEDAEPTISAVLLVAGEAFNFLLAVVSDVVTGIINTVSSILEFLENVFKGDWEAVWNDLVGFLKRSIVPDMESIGVNIIEGLKNGIFNAWDSLKETVGNVASGVVDKFKDVLGIHSPSTVMDENGAYLIEGLKNGVAENMASVLELFNSLGLSIEEILTALNESTSLIISEMLEMIYGKWTELFEHSTESWTELNNMITQMLTLMNTNILTSLTTTNANWMAKWTQMLQTTKKLCNEIIAAVSDMNRQVQAMCASMMAAINAVKAAAASLGSVGGGGSSGGGGGGARMAAAPAMASYSAQSFSALTREIPHLASGSVIRGGNPFLAILGDQPAGKTNIETPANLIKDMVVQGIAEAGIGSRENVPVNINIIYDGETTARVMIPDILQELGRQGYNVDLLGYT